MGLPELLGANIHEQIYRWPWMNKERAYVQLISKLLGVEFDAIWQRHKRLLIKKTVCWAIGIIVVLSALVGVWLNNQPVDVKVRLNEVSVHNENLPPLKDAVVTLTLDNELKIDTILTLDASAILANIPHRYLNKEVSVRFTCRNYMDVDTFVVLTKEVVLNIYRNPSIYGDIHFRLWNLNTEKPVANAEVEIAGMTATSNNDGLVTLFIPLEVQQTKYFIKSSIPLANDTVFLPCGPDDVILMK